MEIFLSTSSLLCSIFLAVLFFPLFFTYMTIETHEIRISWFVHRSHMYREGGDVALDANRVSCGCLFMSFCFLKVDELMLHMVKY